MPGQNITRAEAQERARHLSIRHYDISLDVTTGDELFRAKSIVTFTATPGYDTFIDAVGKKVITATLNGAPVDVSNYDGESIFLKNLQAENELIIELDSPYSKTGEGLQRSVDPVDNEVYLYSQGETSFIRNMYPCFDQPDLKATFNFTVTAPAHWEVVSNNPVKTTATSGEKKTWEFTTTPIMSTYITAVIAGPYAYVRDTYKGEKEIPLGIYCRKSLFEKLDSENIFRLTKQGFDYFQKVFGLAYPFDKYDQIAVVDFNWGAMENAGAVTWREETLVFRSKVTKRAYTGRASTLMHEMAHMWFGNLVTMRWWDDLWLNEAFAEWVSYLAITEGTEFTSGWTDFTAIRKTAAYAQDQLTTTHPISTDMIDIDTVKSNFDMISYAKGASALQQLAAYCGRENFIKGLQNYFKKFAYKNTTLDDLIGELSATSGRDLNQWVSTWIKSAGVNTLRSKIEIEGDSYSSISITQEPPKIPAGSKELRQHRLAVGLFDLKNNELVRRRAVELDVIGSQTEVTELKGEKVADLVLINDSDLTYAKVRLDPQSIETLKNHIGKLSDGLSRTVCWSASWDMMRDAELSASDYINIVLAGLGTEDDITVLGQLLVQLNSAVEIYTSDKNRDAQREKVATALESLLNKAAPESDHQLQFARAFASLASTPAHGARVRELLEGKLAGLKVDSDLRWHFVTCLVERGLSSQAEVAQELEKDNTFTGQLAAELCNAAFPTKAAKDAAWKKATEGDHTIWIKLYNIRGYNRPLHRALHVDFIDPYLNMLLDVWANSSYEISSMLIQGLFPSYVTNQPTLTKVKNWIATTGKDAHPSLKRFINEGIEAMERALKVQALEN